MVVYYAKQDHLVHLVDILVDDESVKLVDKYVELILTLDLVMFLVKYLFFNL